MHRTTPRLTRRHIDAHTHDLLARLSSKLDQVHAYDRFGRSRGDGTDQGPSARRQDVQHAQLLLSALRMRLRATPARSVRHRDIHRVSSDGEP